MQGDSPIFFSGAMANNKLSRKQVRKGFCDHTKIKVQWDEVKENLSPLSDSYCITGISKPADAQNLFI